jgi:endoglucanase
MPQYWNADVVQWLSDDWRVSVVRAAVGVEQDGYLDNPVEEMRKLEAVIQGCISAGVYVIVDWHDYHARNHVEEAKAFFGQVAKKWGHHPNVLFEPYNEPQQASWRRDLKPYFEEVIAEIRKHSDNLVICGTRSWDEQVSLAASAPVSATNIAYTIHFYAASMGQLLRDEVAKALKRGVPVFVTEWGTCEYTGDGMLNLTETKAWLDFLKDNHVSDVNWAISDKDESCSALLPGASSRGHWSDQDLTASGKYVRASLRASAGLETEPDISGEPRAATAGVEKPLLFK